MHAVTCRTTLLPGNWSNRRKACHLALAGSAATATVFASSVIGPGTRGIQSDFGVTRELSLLPVTVFVLGIGFGPVIGAPLSEIYGRIGVYRITLALSLVFTIGAAVTKTYAGLLAFRLLAGLSSGPAASIWGGVVADLGHDLPTDTAVAVCLAMLGVPLGPLVGAFAAQYKDWRWTQWCAAMVFGGLLLLSLLAQETYAKAILRENSKPESDNQDASPARRVSPRAMLTLTLIRPITMLITESAVVSLALYTSVYFGCLYGFLEAIPFVFGTTYAFTVSQQGLPFAGIVIGTLIGLANCVVINKTVYCKLQARAEKKGQTKLPPKYRLIDAMIGSVGLPISLFWFGWSSSQTIHWIVPCLAGIPFGWTSTTFLTSMVMYLLEFYGSARGASALAATGIARFSAAAIFPLFTTHLYESLGVHWSASVFGFIGILLMPIPWILFKFDHKIVASSLCH